MEEGQAEHGSPSQGSMSPPNACHGITSPHATLRRSPSSPGVPVAQRTTNQGQVSHVDMVLTVLGFLVVLWVCAFLIRQQTSSDSSLNEPFTSVSFDVT